MTEPTPELAAGTRPEPDLSGRQIGDFRLLRRLGRGAMAEVYLAEQGSLRRQVAIKVLKPHLARDEQYVRRFHHEAQAAAKLVHTNIVQIYDVGCHDGVHFIAQEYVQGQNLRELIGRQGRLDPPTVLVIMRQTALALAKASAAGIVHRDIKPENILLSRSGEVKVADFGLARIVTDTGELNLTQVGVTLGTPLYMSPEQVEGQAVDPRSDLYSLGVTCYHALVGEPPFRGETALSVAVQHLKSEPRRLETCCPEVPGALARIIHQLLAKRREERFASAQDLLRELRNVPLETDEGWWEEASRQLGLSAEESPARELARKQLSSVMQTQALLTRRRKRRLGWLLASAVVALALGGLVAWLVRPPYLLADAAQLIPQQPTPSAQFFLAQLQLNDREAWLKSVLEYFPSDRYYTPRAKQELVRLYLQQNRPIEALDFSRQLTLLGESEREFRAFGLAGQCIALTMLNRYSEAAVLLAELWPLRQSLDPQMARLMEYPLRANRRALNQEMAQGWDEWVRGLPPPPGDLDQGA